MGIFMCVFYSGSLISRRSFRRNIKRYKNVFCGKSYGFYFYSKSFDFYDVIYDEKIVFVNYYSQLVLRIMKRLDLFVGVI